MKAYEDLLYERWRQQVESVLPTLLKRTLLRSEVPTTVKFDIANSGTAEHTCGSSALFTAL